LRIQQVSSQRLSDSEVNAHTIFPKVQLTEEIFPIASSASSALRNYVPELARKQDEKYHDEKLHSIQQFYLQVAIRDGGERGDAQTFLRLL